MPLEWVDYREAARLYHTEQVAYTCGTLLYRLYGGTCARTGLRTIVDVNSIIATVGVTGNPGNLRGAAYTPPLNNQTLFRRDAYLCLYCGARFTYSLLSRDHVTPFSRGGHDTWSNVVSACRRCNNAKASRTPEQAGMQLLAVPFTPTYAEYIFLKGRRVLADQMEYLVAHFPALQPAARAHATLADVSAAAGFPLRGPASCTTSTPAISFSAPTIPCRPTWWMRDGNATHALVWVRALSVGSARAGAAGTDRRRLRSEPAQRDLVPQRHLSGYKANRESPPAELERQFALCREFCRHMGLAEFASAEYEADDIIGTLAARSRAAGLRNVLVTRDKDLSQLIRDGDVFLGLQRQHAAITTTKSARASASLPSSLPIFWR